MAVARVSRFKHWPSFCGKHTIGSPYLLVTQMTDSKSERGLAWQVGVWDRMAGPYVKEVDTRFEPVIEQLLLRAGLQVGENVLDLGTGTGAAALIASEIVGSSGHVTGIDISPEMLAIAEERTASGNLTNISLKQGSAETIPVQNDSQDVVLSSLVLMYVIDRDSAAKEIARVLRPGGRGIVVVWAGPEDTDIVKFQQAAGRFAPKPPVDGVGPGALADCSPFVHQLSSAGLDVSLETANTRFSFPDFDSAWETLAGVTTANLDGATRREAQASVRDLMWIDSPDGPRVFNNKIQLILVTKPT
jgi:SAM-dependent methyltransferase